MNEQRKRIALATEQGEGLEALISGHFGRCRSFTFVSASQTHREAIETMANPFASGHKPGQIPRWLKDQGAQVIITGGMGRRATEALSNVGIEVVLGAAGSVESALNRYFEGEQIPLVSACSGSGHCHE